MMQKLYAFLRNILTALSFLMLFPSFGVIAYYLLISYDITRVIAGAVSLCVCIHLNKSL